MSKPIIVGIDIETSPIIAYTWGTFKQFIGLNQIIHDWSVLSYCAIDLDDLDNPRKYRYRDVSKQKDFYDDREIMQGLWDELDRADIVITQNGKKFDIKKINARFLAYGMLPPSPYKVIDTMLEARAIAALTSNKLEWLTAVLSPDQKKDKHNDFPGFELWSECLKGNKQAWASMRKYNPQDVVGMLRVYLKLRPFMVGHPNVAVYEDMAELACPKCGSRDVQQRGFTFTQTGKYQRIRCKCCGGWSRTRYTENLPETRKSLLSN